MSEQTNALPRHLRPSFVTEPIITNEPGVAADMQRVEQDIKDAFKRAAPQTAAKVEPRTALQEIAERIKKLIHDHGEDFGECLEKFKEEKVTTAKALQLWADAELKKNSQKSD